MILSYVYVAEWQLLTRFVLFVLLLIVILVISHFGFEGGTLVLIASVPGHCLSFTLYIND